MREYLLTLLVAATFAYLAVGLVRAGAIRAGILAEIRDRDVHDVPIPRLGGVGMLVGVLASLAVAAKLPLLHRIFTSGDEIRGVLTGAIVICLVGVIDDVWGLDAVTKLAGQVLAAGLMALQGVQLFWLPWPGRLIVLDATSGTLITVLAVVVTVNAVNFVDGLDGLAAGVVGHRGRGVLPVLLHPRGAARRGPRGDAAADLGRAGRGVRRLPRAQLQPGEASSWATPGRCSSACCWPRARSR